MTKQEVYETIESLALVERENLYHTLGLNERYDNYNRRKEEAMYRNYFGGRKDSMEHLVNKGICFKRYVPENSCCKAIYHVKEEYKDFVYAYWHNHDKNRSCCNEWEYKNGGKPNGNDKQ